MPNRFDWAAVRGEFAALQQGFTYLNTATYGQTPRCAEEAVLGHLRRRNEKGCTDFLQWFDDLAVVRAKCAELVNAPSGDDIAFAGTASQMASWLMNGLDWRAGDRVLALHGEFPNNLYIPGAMQAERGLEFVECDGWDELESRLAEGEVRAVMVSTVNYATGYRPHLDGLGDRVRAAGGVLYVDATQSAGAVVFDVQKVRPHVLAVNAYKWLISPNGAGFAYIDPEFRKELRPSVVGWRSDYSWRGVDSLHHGAPRYSDLAERYEGGMLDFASLYAMGAVLDLILGLGKARVEDRVLDLAGKCAAVLEEFGGEIAHRGSGIVAAKFAGVDASELAARLKQQDVLVSARYGRLRVSTHFYNNEDDLARLKSVLGGVLGAG